MSSWDSVWLSGALCWQRLKATPGFSCRVLWSTSDVCLGCGHREFLDLVYTQFKSLLCCREEKWSPAETESGRKYSSSVYILSYFLLWHCPISKKFFFFFFINPLLSFWKPKALKKYYSYGEGTYTNMGLSTIFITFDYKVLLQLLLGAIYVL